MYVNLQVFDFSNGTFMERREPLRDAMESLYRHLLVPKFEFGGIVVTRLDISNALRTQIRVRLQSVVRPVTAILYECYQNA